MIVKTINGNVILDYQHGTSAGKHALFAVNYEPLPDAGHSYIQQTNTDLYPCIEKEVSNLIIFKAYMAHYDAHTAYNKLKEINFKFE